MIVVLDTNLIVSSTYFSGKPELILQSAVRQEFSIAISAEILAEYIEVVDDLSTQYSAKADWLNPVVSVAKFFLPGRTEPICSDPDDEIFIQCAVAASADYIVSGDKKHLLKLKFAHGIPIISIVEFLNLLNHQPPAH
ncbi:MAG: putative toxin-antitoxin system toxin component, PIN family [Verrucomicrobiota bacterium]